MITKEIRLAIVEMRESGIQDRAEELHNWLYGDRQKVFTEVLAYVALQNDLIECLTRELADLRKEAAPVEKRFFPMSTSPSHKYR